MQARRVGRSGLSVSTLGLGTMAWGRGVEEDDAAATLLAFHEAGGTLIDTAASYSDGAAEAMLGRLMADLLPRDHLVISAKAGVTRRTTAERRVDASRGTLLRQLDESLERLGTDWVDLWQVHAPDKSVPLEETLAALDSAVASGRVRYAGLSNYPGWRLAQAVTWQQCAPGRAPIVAAQMEYGLSSRGIEREVLPACVELGVGVLAYAPLGGGLLTGKYRSGVPADSRAATETSYGARMRQRMGQVPPGIVEAVATAADGLGTTPLAVALAWARDQAGVAAVLLGVRTHAQLVAALAAGDVTLPVEIRAALDDVSAISLGYPERFE